MTERDHNGEPIRVKELPCDAHMLRHNHRISRGSINRRELFSKELKLQEEAHKHTEQRFELLKDELHLVIEESLKSVNKVADFDLYQKLRVHEAIANSVVLTAEIVNGYLSESVYSNSSQSTVEDLFFNAVESVDVLHRGLIDKLWSEIST